MPQSSPLDSPAKALRVLCLHGFRTNSKVMADQMRDLRRTLQQAYRDLKIEFVYINGVIEATDLSDPMIESYYAAHKPFYEWWPLPKDYAMIDPNSVQGGLATLVDRISRGNSEDTWGAPYDRMDDTIAYAHAKIQKLGTFDMAVGFSQGAALLTVLTMWYLKHHQCMPWKLNVCVNGMRIDGPVVRSVFTSENGSQLQVPVPSVHFVGKSDPVAHETRKLAAMYQSRVQATLLKIVVEHEGGHRFPSLKRDPGVYGPVVRMLNEVCSHLAVSGLEDLALSGRLDSKPSASANATTAFVSRL